jgi:hypothetical protein
VLKRFAPAAIIVVLLALLVGQALTSDVTPTATTVPAATSQALASAPAAKTATHERRRHTWDKCAYDDAQLPRR